jgi:PucR family transcriptional regulator, purine catabolism regulatory protein
MKCLEVIALAVTVQHARNLPIMSQTKLVAGASGIHRLIQWVTIVEVIEDISRFQEGEFLITTGFDLLKKKSKWDQFIKLIKSKKLSGIAVYTGFYLHTIPQRFIEAADDCEIPLIEIPSNINFSSITKEILEQLVNEQFKLFQHTLTIHQELTNLVLQNKGEAPITKTLSRLTKASIIVIKVNGKITSHAIDANAILLQENSLLIKEYKMNLLDLLNKKIHNTVKKDVKRFGFHLFLCPIIANKNQYGLIVGIKKQEEWQELDGIAIEQAATVYAVEYLKQDAILETEIALKGEFLEELLNDHFVNTPHAIQRAKRVGYNLTKPQIVLICKLIGMHGKNESNTNSFIIEHLYNLVSRIFKQLRKPLLIRKRLESVIILTSSDTHHHQESVRQIKDIGFMIEKTWIRESKNDYPIIIGIGRTNQTIENLSKSVREAEHAITLSSLLLEEKRVIHFEDLGMYQLLIQMHEAGVELKQFYQNELGELLSHGKKGEDLLITLETYLLNNLNIQTASSKLYIHRHTLKYRLNQIEKKTGYSLESPDMRMKLHLAIMAYKLCTNYDFQTNQMIKKEEKK